jgi:hypothetical protein
MLTDISEVHTASIIRAISLITLMMETVRTSETLVSNNLTTWRYIPEDSKLQITSCFHETKYSLFVAANGARGDINIEDRP